MVNTKHQTYQNCSLGLGTERRTHQWLLAKPWLDRPTLTLLAEGGWTRWASHF